MDFRKYHTASNTVKNQINSVSDIWLKHLGDAVLGIYIHGSLAINCFHEDSSDIDILIVTKRRLLRDERLQIAKEIILVDQKPCPLEMSAIWINDLSPWKHPVPCQFHYSDYWTETYERLIENKSEVHFLVDDNFKDTDITSHIHVTNQSGICIYGKPNNEVFPVISEKDFWKSISSDVDDYDFNAYNPKYFVSNILILGRILSYKKLKRVLSKYEGALWTLTNVPLEYNYIINNALRVWYRGESIIEYDKQDLENLRLYLINEIK